MKSPRPLATAFAMSPVKSAKYKNGLEAREFLALKKQRCLRRQ